MKLIFGIETDNNVPNKANKYLQIQNYKREQLQGEQLERRVAAILAQSHSGGAPYPSH